MNISDAASAARLPVGVVRRAIEAGELPSGLTATGRTVITPSDLQGWLDVELRLAPAAQRLPA